MATRSSLTLFYAVDEKLSFFKALGTSWRESKKVWPQLLKAQLVFSGLLFLLFCPILLIMLLSASKLSLNQTGILITMVVNGIAVVLLFPVLQGTLLTYLAGIKRLLSEVHTLNVNKKPIKRCQ